MKKKPPTPKQREIARKEHRDTCATDKWLRDTGVNPAQLTDLDCGFVKAQKIAHDLVQHHSEFLDCEQLAAVKKFTKLMRDGGTKRLTKAQAFRVMNIGAAVNRRLFKQHRQLNTQLKRQLNRHTQVRQIKAGDSTGDLGQN